VIAKDLCNPQSSCEAVVETRGCVVAAKQPRPHDESTHSQDQED
jgi:hypothetical protein